MMLRLQCEKAEVQMELRQFRRFAYEKMALAAAEIDQLCALLSQRARRLVRPHPARPPPAGTPRAAAAPPARAPSSPPTRAAPTAAAAMAQPFVVKKDDDLG